MKTTLKRIASALLAVAMMMSLLMTSAFAASTRKCYTIKTGDTTVYSNTSLTKKYGTIYDTDEIIVLDVHDKYTKVTYPISGGTKTGYINTSAILLATTGTTKTATAKITTYKRASSSATYGSIAKGDIVIVLGTKDGYTQVKYPVSDGYKYAFITSKNADKYLEGGNVYTSMTAIEQVAEDYDISTSSNAYKALKLINSSYASQLTASQRKGVCVFMFEGVGKSSSTSKRENAMCVVVNNGEIVYLNQTSSTLPDSPFNPKMNGGDAMPTVKSGIYSFTTVLHHQKYAALNVTSAKVVRFNSKSDFYSSTSEKINVHAKSTDKAATSGTPNSAGCLLIGKASAKSGYLSSTYVKFCNAVGICNKSTMTAYTSYTDEVSGKIIIDRTYASSYMKKIGYSADAIKKIG